ncbi:uncharacterized protein AB675_1759 [Cyphellophora attinorum]|uniref:Heterokaryon incompatibility domain-containing protein n=1 Tax=Cyphellophora attinorum TaxID=1664694 RepID=A0A0N1P1R6_9EURO|nr:uncharacterized protein AB675_1759 [Phialophora attinorum]KPI42652.1 hypothetical protein AB675_1759 [Phialophora attinorum]
MPHFYALSYEWGTDQPSHALNIDGKTFPIRKNLKLFLDRIHSSTHAFIRPLWIDAICIDQCSNSERNEQVKIMGRIFAEAILVLTWLGPKSMEDGTLVETEVTLQDWRDSDEYARIKEGQVVERPSVVSLRDPYGQMWNCLQQLCQLSYWKRRWIIQELIKANKLLFLWGVGQITWDALSAAFLAVLSVNRHRRSSAPITMTGPWDAIYTSIPFSVWQHVHDIHVNHRLLQVMETYQHSQCSVFHDKAYALTGISTNAHQLQVDYDKSLPDLYADLMDLEPKSPHCLKYSKLILDALCIDRKKWETGPVVGKTVISKALKISPVTAVSTVPSPVTPALIDTEMWELFQSAGAMSISKMNEIIRWAKDAYSEISAKTHRLQRVSYFLLLDGQVGMSISAVTPGSVVYMVNGATEESDPLYLCQSSEHHRVSSTSSVSSLSREVSRTNRVWLAPSTNATFEDSGLSDSLDIRLGDLYDMNGSLDWDISPDTPLPSPTEAPTSPQLKLRRPHSDNAEIRSPPHRSSTAGSSSIDEALRPRPRTKTWPPVEGEEEVAKTDGWYIDALARNMRDKLFIGPSGKMNTPD